MDMYEFDKNRASSPPGTYAGTAASISRRVPIAYGTPGLLALLRIVENHAFRHG
jgi:hypothetical protein